MSPPCLEDETPHRRTVLAGMAVGLSMSSKSAFGQPTSVRLGSPRAFSFEALIAGAKAASVRPYKAPSAADPILDAIDFDAYSQIAYDPNMTLWGGAGEPAVRLFPQGRLFKAPVRINLVSGGAARAVIYTPDFFQTPANHPFRRLKVGGFAGFRVMNAGGRGDWLAFLGASYFRAVGPFAQYGASARGLAINSGGPSPEEFPRFSEFWLEKAGDGGLIAYAFLDGPSVAGAYRFENYRTADGVTQKVDVALFFRQGVETLGVAPMTSMFWYGENSPPKMRDWRPEVHDSDGLALWTGKGERIWRPLDNPPRVITNAFQDDNPLGFGLSQRDRIFDHYQDDGVFYDKRPSIWIKPETPFAVGSVRLLEIPSNNETDDNICAFWTPAQPVIAGSALRFNYKIEWISDYPEPPLAKVVATRTGLGGHPGLPAKVGYRRIAIDFDGNMLAGLTRNSGVEAIVTTGDGALIEDVSAYPVVGTPLWRLIFDVATNDHVPTNIRAYLKRGDAALSETWLYQLFPEQ